MVDGYLTETQLATVLRRTKRTLRIWRAKGLGPAYTRVGNSVVYRDKALRRLVATQRSATSQSAKALTVRYIRAYCGKDGRIMH